MAEIVYRKGHEIEFFSGKRNGGSFPGREMTDLFREEKWRIFSGKRNGGSFPGREMAEIDRCSAELYNSSGQ